MSVSYPAITYVTRAKRSFRHKRRCSHFIDKTSGLRCDQTVVSTGIRSKKDYSETMRRAVYRDDKTGKRFVFLTNSFTPPGLSIAQLYNARRQVE